MKYNVLIAEDEIPAQNLLVKYVKNFPELVVKDIAGNGKEAIEKLSAQVYDLVLLDIHLPVYSGIEVLEKIETFPYVIFTTAYDKYAIKAFDFGAIDYLLKPISRERFNRSIERFLIAIKEGNKKSANPLDCCLSFKDKGRHYLVPFNDIIYLSSHSKKTILHTDEMDFETSCTLKESEEKLPRDMFVRIHKQYIVNIKYFYNIENHGGGQATVYLNDRDETNLPVGRIYQSEFKKKLKI